MHVSLCLLALLCPCSGLGLDFTAEQQAAIRGAATRSVLPAACAAAEEPSDAEIDFAAQASLKYFPFDFMDSSTWEVLDGLQECLETVANESWLGEYSNLWDANLATMTEFASHVHKDQWRSSSWLEDNSMPVNGSALSNLSAKTGAYRAFGASVRDLWVQQPCNAVSNAAMYFVSLETCRLEPSFLPAPYGYTFAKEMKSLGAMLAFGSFAFHAGSFESSSAPDGHAGTWLQTNTGYLDTVVMQAMFYLIYQVQVYAWAGDGQDMEALEAVLTLNGQGVLDGRTKVHSMQLAFTQESTVNWDVALNDAKSSLPPFIVSCVGVVLINLRGIFASDLWGDFGNVAFELACRQLFQVMLGSEPDHANAENEFCSPTAGFSLALSNMAWKAPKSLDASLRMLFDTLEIFIEAFYFQEQRASPAGYLQRWLDLGVIGSADTACWKMPHAIWHKEAAYVATELVKVFGTQFGDMTTDTPMSTEQQSASWANAQNVATSLQAIFNSLTIMQNADQLNYCTVLRLAKECAMADPPCGKPQMTSLLEPETLSLEINKMLQPYDTISGIVSIDNKEVPDPLELCKYTFSGSLDSVSGLASFGLADLTTQVDFVAGSSAVDPVIRASVGFESCRVALAVHGSGSLLRQRTDQGSFGDEYLCKDQSAAVVLRASLLVVISGDVSLDVNLNQLISGGTATFTTDLSALQIQCQDVTLLPHSNSLHAEMSYSQLNAAIDTTIQLGACEMISEKFQAELQSLLLAEAQTMGRRVSGALQEIQGDGSGRRVEDVCKSPQSQMVELWSQEDIEYLQNEGSWNTYGDDDSISISGAFGTALPLVSVAFWVMQLAIRP